MDFCKTKQPIALPIDSEGEGLLGANKEFDPELATNAPQQRECVKRCRFAKGTKGRKVLRRVGHFVLLSAFLYWVVSPSVKSYIHRGGHNLPDIKFSDFTDLDTVPGTVPEDFQWATFDSDEELECDQYAHWSEPVEIKPPCGRPHRHHKPHRPDRPAPPHHPEPPHHPPDHPEPPHHPPHGPDHPHEPDHPHKPDHPHGPDHPHKPDHPHRPHHPHKPHHPHRPGRRHGPKYTSDATFKLPLADSSLLFYSHGPFAFGGIKFSQDDSDSLKSDEVEVTINAKIWNKDALDLAKVCTLKRDHGAGLGIWTEPGEHHNPEERKKHALALRISVKFPKHPDTLEIKKLHTHMPLFAHLFEGADLKFNDLKATTFLLPIKAEALSVDRGHLRTENNVIVGNFTATEFLVLDTKNSPIAVNVTLVNDPEEEVFGDEGVEFSKLFIQTSNSPLHANISLVSAAKDHSGGKFSIDTITRNSPLHVNFADAPIDSALRFVGSTTNSPALAALHPTYQGDFLVKSSLFKPKVDIDEDVDDPTGEGRTRTVDVSKVGREIAGKVYWGSEEDKDALGHVELSSTLLRAKLKL